MEGVFPALDEAGFGEISRAMAQLKRRRHPADRDSARKHFLQDFFSERRRFLSKSQAESLFDRFLDCDEDDYEIGHVVVIMCNVPWLPVLRKNGRGALCYWGNAAECPAGVVECVKFVIRNANFIRVANVDAALFPQLPVRRN